MAELTYRDAVSSAIAQEMDRDPAVYFLGEDVAAAGGVFKATTGLLERFGPVRVRDTPISEEAIVGLAMGAAMTGLRPIVEIMFSDFLATCWDIIANQIAKTRYMTNGQIALPLVVRTANGGGSRFGAQHSQSLEAWAMAVPGLKVVAPSTPADVKGLLAGVDPRSRPGRLLRTQVPVPGEGRRPRGRARGSSGRGDVRREGSDLSMLSLAAMVPRSLEAAEQLAARGIDAEVIDLRSLVPLDVSAIATSVRKTSRLFTVEENPRLCGWGAEVASIVADECFDDLDGPIVRITSPHVPLPAADGLEDATLPSAGAHRRDRCSTDGLMLCGRREGDAAGRGKRLRRAGLRRDLEARLPAWRQPNLKDVAKAAGVHVGTASRALNERTVSMVSPETVERVREAAETLGYRVNRVARGLKTRRSFTIGMLVPDITNPFFPPMVRGAENGSGRGRLHVGPRGHRQRRSEGTPAPGGHARTAGGRAAARHGPPA